MTTAPTDHVAAAIEAGALAAQLVDGDYSDQTEAESIVAGRLEQMASDVPIAVLTALVGSEEVLARIGKPIGLYRLQMRNRGLVVRSTDVAMARAAVAAIIDLLSKGEN
jgi:hypothetical protein